MRDIVLSICVLFIFCIPAYTQSFDWIQQGPHAWTEGRAKHATAIISDNQIMLFGGVSVGIYEGDLQDTWVYDVSLDSWDLKSPSSSPSARSCHAMAYIGDDKVILFGGLEDNTNHFDDTWIYDLSDESWTLMNPTTYPSARCNHKLVNIGGDRVLLYGGYHGWSDFNNETWTYDFSDNIWTQRNPSSTPSPRGAYGMSYIGNNQVVLFGGAIDVDNDGYAIQDNETWIYNLNSNEWTKKSPSIVPAKRIYHDMAYIGGDQSLLFGGFGPDRETGTTLNDSWIYDLSADLWIELSFSTPEPAALLAHSLSPIQLQDTRSIALFLGSRNRVIDDLSIETWLLDWQDPVITFTYTPPATVNVNCDESTTTDNTGGSLTGITNCITGGLVIDYSDQTVSGPCDNEYSIIRTWTASDDCGTSSTYIQTINVSDNIAPNIDCSGIPSVTTFYVATENDFINLDDFTDMIEGSDNCQGAITISQNPIQGTSLGVGSHTITFRASDVCSNVSNPCTKSIVVGVDSSPPAITIEDYPPYFNRNNSSIEIRVEAEDNFNIERVICNYRGIAMNNNQITSKDLSYIEGNTYSIIFQDSDFDEQGIEFTITAYDLADNNDSTGPHFIYNEFDESNSPELDDLRYGVEQEKYEIIAIPFQQNTSNLGISSLFNDEFGQYGDTKVWRLWKYINDQIENVEFGNSGFNDSQFQIGKGYWLITKNNVTIDIGPCNTIEFNQGNPYTITLNPGYNQIGNPYNFNVDWSYVIDVNREIIGSAIDLINNPIKLYKGHWNDRSNIIQAKRGAFIYNNSTQPITVTIPVVKNPAQSTARIQDDDFLCEDNWISENGNEWIISLNLKYSNHTYLLGGIGMLNGAKLKYDKYDDITPPRFMKYLEIYTLNPEHAWGRITRDVIQIQDTSRWDFVIDNNFDQGFTELSWNREIVRNLNKKLVLYDQGNDQLYHMSEIAKISFKINSNEKKPVRILYGDMEFINRNMIPDLQIVGDPYPNPFEKDTYIPIYQPIVKNESLIELYIYDISGKKIKSVLHIMNSESRSLIQWDGRDDFGHDQPSGMYIIHIKNEQNNITKKKLFKR